MSYFLISCSIKRLSKERDGLVFHCYKALYDKENKHYIGQGQDHEYILLCLMIVSHCLFHVNYYRFFSIIETEKATFSRSIVSDAF